MNKQELIEIIIKNIDDIGAYALGVDTLLAQGILGLRNQVNGLKEQLDEPSREECEVVETERNDYVSDFQCSKCKTSFDLFRWINAPNTKVNYCPNCGSKIKREKRDDK